MECAAWCVNAPGVGDSLGVVSGVPGVGDSLGVVSVVLDCKGSNSVAELLW